MKLQTIKTAISRTAGRGGLVLQKHSPEILMVVGVVGVVVSTVMACKATLKADVVINDAKKKFDTIHQAKETIGVLAYAPKDRYTEQDYKKDITVAYIQTGVNFVKLYGPSVAVGVAAIGCIIGSHGIMRKRNLAVIAAYKAVEQGFADYRKRVVEELGEKADRHYKYGTSEIEVTEMEYTDENGVKHEAKTTTVESVDPNMHSQYAVYFDTSSTQWSRLPEYNKTFLICQQNYFNDLLKARGHVFLNEVHDALGVPRTQAGAVVGWIHNEGDEFIDFGIFDGNKEAVRHFVNGHESSILLDFNVAGVIYDLI